MNYEQKYKDALERARELKNKLEKNCSLATPTGIESIFTELAVSEDERIRKELIRLLNVMTDGIIENYTPIPLRDLVAWLEKQGEQKPADKVEPKFKVGDWVTDGEYTWKVTNIKRLDYILQSQNGDMVDDTISYVDEHFYLWTIEDAKDGDVLVCESGERTLECLFIFKLIADREVHEYCSYRTIDKHFSLKDSFLGYVDNVYHPATKEQRDILFSKMKEAGYEWDFDKKELRKIDDYCKENCKGFQETGKCYADGKCKAKREVEQKSDNKTPYPKTLDKAIDLYYYSYGDGEGGFDYLSLDKFRDIVHTFIEDYGQKSTEWSDIDERAMGIIGIALRHYDMDGKWDRRFALDWLKSLKPQSHWKPTDEQMQSLYFAIITYSKKDDCKLTYDGLNSLYDDLKKL